MQLLMQLPLYYKKETNETRLFPPNRIGYTKNVNHFE